MADGIRGNIQFIIQWFEASYVVQIHNDNDNNNNANNDDDHHDNDHNNNSNKIHAKYKHAY